MVFALDGDNGELLAFSSPVETDAQCKRISEDSPGFPGAYTLQRPMSGLWLQERIARILMVKGCGLTTVEELVETLKINRSKRVAGDAKRG